MRAIETSRTRRFARIESRRWRSKVALLVLGCLLAAGASNASEVLEFCFNEWRPYTYTENGEAQGLTIEITRLACERAGFEARFRELPWNRCLELVKQGAGMDAVLDAARRPGYLQGPTSINVYTNTFWVRAASPATRFETSALRGASIGLVRGYSYPESLLRLIEKTNMSVEYAKSDIGNLRLLEAGRIDFMIGDYVGTWLQARAEGVDVRPLRPDHSADRLYTSFSETRADVQRRFEAALASLVDEGVVSRVYRERLGVDLTDLLSPR